MTTIPTIEELQLRCEAAQDSIDRASPLMMASTHLFGARIIARSISDADLRNRLDTAINAAIEAIREVKV